MPIFISFNKKTGLKIDEFGDIRLMVDNLLLKMCIRDSKSSDPGSPPTSGTDAAGGSGKQ